MLIKYIKIIKRSKLWFMTMKEIKKKTATFFQAFYSYFSYQKLDKCNLRLSERPKHQGPAQGGPKICPFLAVIAFWMIPSWCAYYILCVNMFSDVDECVQYAHICSHSCRNTAGGFVCDCQPGYRLHSDGRTCNEVEEHVTGRYTCGLFMSDWSRLSSSC